MPTKVDIISGFLGAGKTTLIRKLLAESLAGEKIAIIENEFGEMGIDGARLGGAGVEVREMNSGCICCSLAGDFEKSIREVVERFAPDRLIIEPSGVGKLSDVVRGCEISRLGDVLRVNMLIAIVNPLKYELYLKHCGSFFKDQISTAKTILLSRTQDAEPGVVAGVVAKLRALNPTANIVTTPWDQLTGDRMIEIGEGDAAELLSASAPHQHDASCGHNHGTCKHEDDHGHDHNHDGHHHRHEMAEDVFDAWSHETPSRFDEQTLRSAFLGLEADGNAGLILRGKGIVQTPAGDWIEVDFTPGEFKTIPAQPDYTGRLCIIGRDLDKEKLGSVFK